MPSFFKLSLLKPLLLASLFFLSLPSFSDSSLETLEQSSGGRLGISALDTGNNRLIQYRASERFPFDSSFKFMLA